MHTNPAQQFQMLSTKLLRFGSLIKRMCATGQLTQQESAYINHVCIRKSVSSLNDTTAQLSKAVRRPIRIS
jgi:hypothetical protein